MTLTVRQRATLKLVYERAGEHPTETHVDATSIHHKTLAGLLRHGFIIVNADGTVTLTDKGLLVILHSRDKSASDPLYLHPDGKR